MASRAAISLICSSEAAASALATRSWEVWFEGLGRPKPNVMTVSAICRAAPREAAVSRGQIVSLRP